VLIEAVLFDLDGTLMDHESARRAGLAAQVAEWWPEAGRRELEQVDAEWRRLEGLHYDEYTAGECTFTEQRRRRVHGLHAALGRWPRSDAEADAWFAGYLGHYRACWRGFDDVAPALAALASQRPELALGVVTNGEGEPQRMKLAAIGLADRFEVVVASGEVGVAKPQGAIFALACEQLKVDRERAAYVGDRLDFDAQAASAAGLGGIWLDRLGEQACPEGVVRITTLEELPAALAG
jgi:putative hydrolase of the HAD superfamily